MITSPVRYTLGPDNGTLTVRTRKAGAAAKAGHNLLIEVTAWQGTLELGEEPAGSSVALTVDSRSLMVREGTGGIQALGDDDKEAIKETIDDEVLKGTAIEFRSSRVAIGTDGTLEITGDLQLAGRSHPLTFHLTCTDDDRLIGGATVKQSDWGIKPYSALFGTLKVVDAVEVAIDANLPAD
jgi:polyisoprenoid-binding protein YceI